MAESSKTPKFIEDRVQATVKDLREAVSFLKLENRLQTFTTWIYKDDDPCNKLKLAAAGFVFVPREDQEDLVKCFVCEKQLDGWERTDDPWGEHVSHCPDCPLVKLGKPFSDASLKQILEIWKLLEAKHMDKYYSEIKKTSLETYAQVKKTKRKNRK